MKKHKQGMARSDAIAIFGGTHADMARALGIQRAAVSMMPRRLSFKQTLQVIGAAWNKGLLNRAVRDGLIVKIDVEA